MYLCVCVCLCIFEEYWTCVLDHSRCFQLRANSHEWACLRGQVEIRRAPQQKVEHGHPRPPTPPGQVATAHNDTVPARAERE